MPGLSLQSPPRAPTHTQARFSDPPIHPHFCRGTSQVWPGPTWELQAESLRLQIPAPEGGAYRKLGGRGHLNPQAGASGGQPTGSQQGKVFGEQTEPEGSAEWKFQKALGPASSSARWTWLLACDAAAVLGWTGGKVTNRPSLPGSWHHQDPQETTQPVCAAVVSQERRSGLGKQRTLPAASRHLGLHQ